MECFKVSRATFAAIAFALAAAAEVQAGDIDALRAADAAWNESMQSRSYERIASHYADDAIADLGTPEPVRGRAAISAFWQEAFKNPKYSLRWELESAGVVEGDNRGYTLGKWHQETDEGSTSGIYVAFWERHRDGRWLVVVDTAR